MSPVLYETVAEPVYRADASALLVAITITVPGVEMAAGAL